MSCRGTAHDLHRLVLIHGCGTVPEKQRPLMDIAAEVMVDESRRIVAKRQ